MIPTWGATHGSATPVLLANKLVVVVGDSLIVGVGAGSGGTTDVNGSRPFSIPSQAANRLVALGIASQVENVAEDNNNGITQAAWNGYRPDITVTGTLSPYSGGPSAGGVIPRQTATGTVAWKFTTTTNVTDFDVWVPRAAAGVMGVSIDGGAIQNITQSAAGDLLKTTFSGLSDATHSIQFTRVSGTAIGPLLVNGYKSATPSVQIINAGARDWTTADWTQTTTNTPSEPINALAFYQPDVLVIQLGTNNERQGGFTIAQLKIDIQLIVTTVQTTKPSCKIIFQLPPPIAAGSQISFTDAQLRQAYVDLQAANAGSVFIDSPARLATLAGVNPATWTALNNLSYEHDNLHPNVGVGGDGGVYRVIGYAMADAIKTALGL